MHSFFEKRVSLGPSMKMYFRLENWDIPASYFSSPEAREATTELAEMGIAIEIPRNNMTVFQRKS